MIKSKNGAETPLSRKLKQVFTTGIATLDTQPFCATTTAIGNPAPLGLLTKPERKEMELRKHVFSATLVRSKATQLPEQFVPEQTTNAGLAAAAREWNPVLAEVFFTAKGSNAEGSTFTSISFVNAVEMVASMWSMVTATADAPLARETIAVAMDPCAQTRAGRTNETNLKSISGRD